MGQVGVWRGQHGARSAGAWGLRPHCPPMPSSVSHQQSPWPEPGPSSRPEGRESGAGWVTGRCPAPAWAQLRELMSSSSSKANRSHVNYDPMDEIQIAEINSQVRRYLEGALDEIDVRSSPGTHSCPSPACAALALRPPLKGCSECGGDPDLRVPSATEASASEFRVTRLWVPRPVASSLNSRAHRVQSVPGPGVSVLRDLGTWSPRLASSDGARAAAPQCCCGGATGSKGRWPCWLAAGDPDGWASETHRPPAQAASSSRSCL